MTYLEYFQQNAKNKRYSVVHYYTRNDLPVFTGDRNRIIKTFSCKQLCECYLNLHLKFGVILSQTYKDMTLYLHMYQNVYSNSLQKNFSVQAWPLYKCRLVEKYCECFSCFGAI